MFGAQACESHLNAIMNLLPHTLTVCVGGIGMYSFNAHSLGINHCDGIRVGVEDTPFKLDGSPYTNVELLKDVVHNIYKYN